LHLYGSNADGTDIGLGGLMSKKNMEDTYLESKLNLLELPPSTQILMQRTSLMQTGLPSGESNEKLTSTNSNPMISGLLSIMAL
jgi:hypothetical protein